MPKENSRLVQLTHNPDETRSLGALVGNAVQSGSVIALNGTLGAGKTCWAQGFAASLGINSEVVSPTYTLAIPYNGRLRLIHVDAYRIQDSDELADLGLDDEIADGSVILIEWHDRFENDFPPADIKVEIVETEQQNDRQIALTGCTTLGIAILKSVIPPDRG